MEAEGSMDKEYRWPDPTQLASMRDTLIVLPRCPSCMRIIGDKWLAYRALATRYRNEKIVFAENRALNEVGVTNECCRRIFLTAVDHTANEHAYKLSC